MLEKELDKLLLKVPKEADIENYIFYVGEKYKSNLNNYKGYKIIYPKLLLDYDIYFGYNFYWQC